MEGLLSVEVTGIIESWLPLFVFTPMFGISMDYLNFAITRAEELYRQGYSVRDAIKEGVGDSFGVVFSAAAIVIAVAAVFALMRLFAIQQLGFALAPVVLLDTTVILLVFLPPLIGVAGKYLWYFPSWLECIPGGQRRSKEQEDITVWPAMVPADDQRLIWGSAWVAWQTLVRIGSKLLPDQGCGSDQANRVAQHRRCEKELLVKFAHGPR